jgi:Tfp pilus assembly protein PilN
MRPLQPRETRLALAVVLLLLGFVSYTVVKGRLATLDNLDERRARLEMDLAFQEEALKMRPEWLQSLQSIRAQLPRHPVGRDIKSLLSRQVQSLASGSGLTLTDLTPEPEEFLANLELHRTAIRCRWRGSPEALVGFLVRLQDLGAVTDVRELRLKSEGRGRPMLSGSFVLEFVYSREDTAPETVSPDEMENTL